MVRECVRSCKAHPQHINLIIRLVTFNNDHYEVIGFVEVDSVDENTIVKFHCGGMTALFDATYYSISSMFEYSKVLVVDNEMTVNGSVFIITDGENNISTFTAEKIKTLIEDINKSEILTSLVTILIGINDAQCGKSLQAFKDEAGLSQYVSVANANAKSLAKLGQFISQSISSSSKAILQGQGSQPISVQPSF